jgi:hypothetical protein
MHKFKLVLSVLFIVIIINPLFAVTTTEIDAVRSKDAIADSDTTIIEDFLSEAFSELTDKTDFSDVAVLRNTIVSRSNSTSAAGKIIYNAKYLTAFQTEFADSLKSVNEMQESSRKNVLVTNFLILSYEIGNVQVSKAALNYLQNENVMIRYWAANNFTNNALITALNSGNEADRKEIANKILKAVQAEKSSDVLLNYAQFASGIKDSGGNDILTAIAQKRMDLYLAWNVQDEMTEDGVLKALSERIKTDPDSTKIMGKYFSSLFSLVVQRYIQGQQTISETSKNALVSVILQGDKYVQAFVPDWNGNFKRAVEKDLASLLAESDGLFGSPAGQGKLSSTIGFDYGKNADGSAKLTPPALAKPQAKLN